MRIFFQIRSPWLEPSKKLKHTQKNHQFKREKVLSSNIVWNRSGTHKKNFSKNRFLSTVENVEFLEVGRFLPNPNRRPSRRFKGPSL
jgi:hypothetical protein